MSKIGQYLLSVVAAALIVSISNTLIEKRGVIGSILKLVTGLVLAMVIVSPWSNFRINDLEGWYFSAKADASSFVEMGQLTAQTEISEYIKLQIEAYILDKASTLDLDISAVVSLTEGSMPAVKMVTISGIASPYAKRRLMQIVGEDLDITEESIIWS